jgi:hypothetical protein
MEDIENVMQGIDKDSRKTLIGKITNSGFRVTSSGHIELKGSQIKPDHPRCHGNYLPVGYLIEKNGKTSALLVNTNYKSLKEYHAKLREIYRGIEILC